MDRGDGEGSIVQVLPSSTQRGKNWKHGGRGPRQIVTRTTYHPCAKRVTPNLVTCGLLFIVRWVKYG